MGRPKEGWKLLWRGRIGYVRFTWNGERVDESTGQSDPQRAAEEAAKVYAEVVSGRRVITRAKGEKGVSPQQLVTVELLALWLADCETRYAPRTVKLYRDHVRAHFMERWERLADIHEASVDEYITERLGKVTRASVVKERNTLVAFLGWCCRNKFLPGLPPLPPVPRGALGTRDPNRKEEPTDLSPEEVEAWLAALPEQARGPARKGPWKGRRFPVRDWFTLAWETGLRPSTLAALEVPRHYTRGAAQLRLSKDIDKVRFARPVPLTARARAILDRHAPEAGLIFGPSAGDLRLYIKPAAEAAGLPPAKIATLSPYDLRHARATDLVDQTGDLAGPAYLLGHRQVTTTNRYAKGRLRHAEETLKRLDPGTSSGEDSGEPGS